MSKRNSGGWDDGSSGFEYDYGDSDDEETQRDNYLMCTDTEVNGRQRSLYDQRYDEWSEAVGCTSHSFTMTGSGEGIEQYTYSDGTKSSYKRSYKEGARLKKAFEDKRDAEVLAGFVKGYEERVLRGEFNNDSGHVNAAILESEIKYPYSGRARVGLGQNLAALLFALRSPPCPHGKATSRGSQESKNQKYGCNK